MIEVKNYANDKHWKALIEHFADGKEICNCRNAYYATDGDYQIDKGSGWETHHDGRYCPNGCNANQYDAKEYIAKIIIEDINGRNK